jgi:DNA-binding transcriptional MerR regulator
MPDSYNTPTYNLGVVIQETGLKPDTLRAWERRYSLPRPQRSPGGHRLYSQHDIDTIKWLIARQEEGLSIGNAVDLWDRLEAEGREPLRMSEYAAPEAPAAPALAAVGGTIAELREAWVSACLAFDKQRAEGTLTQAFALYPPETVCFEVLQEGLAYIGEGWYRSEVTVQQEHFASELAMRRLEGLMAAVPAPTRAGHILAACPPDEEHTLGLLLLTLLLRRRGWDVLYLGADVPVESLETATKGGLQLAVSAAQQLHTAAALLDMARLLQEEGIPLAFGGGIFNRLPSLAARIPGHFLGERSEAAPQIVERLLMSPRPTPPVETAPDDYQQALDHFRERLPFVEADVWQAAELRDISRVHLAQANSSLARDIMAALTLGDMDFLGDEIAWAEGLLANYRLPEDMLPRHLAVYCQALQNHLDERGSPIVEWLAQFIR